MRPGEIEIVVSDRTKDLNPGSLRRKKSVPGVVYGSVMKKSISLMTDMKALERFGSHQFENTIFKLKSDNKDLNSLAVLIKDISRHPVTHNPLHVDFLAIDMNKPVRVSVEIRYEGKAVGVSEGGVLQPLLRELDVWVLPSQIPEFLPVDISSLGIMESLHISDIPLPAGVKSAVHDNLAIVTVAYIKEEVITPVAAAAAPVAGTEPEVIGKGKKPEEGAADAKAAGGAKPAAAGAAKAPADAKAKK